MSGRSTPSRLLHQFIGRTVERGDTLSTNRNRFLCETVNPLVRITFIVLSSEEDDHETTDNKTSR
jgi:hypothetical protein